MTTLPSPAGTITQVAGIEVGHFTDPRRPTGCTVIIARGLDGLGVVGGVDVRGAAPGTRETDLLHPSNLIDRVHAITLSGGSAWGLDAASGVMQWLAAHGMGMPVGTGLGLVPIVPAAVLFDLAVGDASIRPDARAGYAACQAARKATPLEGNVGAGAGALVGKLFGIARAMKGGIGSASITLHGITVGAIVACNAVGDVVDPDTGLVIAGARTADGLERMGIRQAILAGEVPQSPLPGTNTTIGVVATDAILTKPQAHRLAQVAHDGLARSINPVHTMLDGDTMFALGTGASRQTLSMMVLGTLAAEVTARAVVRAIRGARSITVGGMTWPSAHEWGTGKAQ